MYQLLIVFLIAFTSINYCFAGDYNNQDLGVKLSIPDGAKVVEGNRLQPFSKEEMLAFKKVFETDPAAMQEALNKTVFTIGYYDGPISEGPNGSIMVAVVPAVTTDIESFSSSLLGGGEEQKTESMRFKFSEFGANVTISERKFIVSKGRLTIIQNRMPVFEMPMIYYITEIDSKFVTFTISGNDERVPSLEQSILAMVIDKKL